MDKRSTNQTRVRKWGDELFMGADKRTRMLRFLEEAIELVQAGGLPLEDQMHVLRVVNAREPGEFGQEVGGVMVTLYYLADVHDVDVGAEEDREIARIHTPEVMEKCRRRQVEKRAMGL